VHGMPDSNGGAEPLIWRIPPWQPALLFVAASGCAALNLYGHPGTSVRVLSIAAGVMAVAAAILALRMYLVADDEGIGVRRWFRESSVNWAEVADVQVVERGFDTMKLRVVRLDGTFVNVPQSLMLPAKPTGKDRTRALLAGAAKRVLAYGEPYRQ
jgi:hypothetical protein